MIVKIMQPAGANFPGVQYNEKKIETEKGNLMLIKNFPSFIEANLTKEVVKNYLASISKNEKVKKPQFHATISTRFREHTKEELTTLSEKFMEEMGYGGQPFLVVFHKDTENNHVHIVSTRVDKSTGKKINDSFEKLKAQTALSKAMEKLYGINAEAKIEKLLQYQFSTIEQLELLLKRSGYRFSVSKNIDNSYDILKNGVREKTLFENQLKFTSKNDPERKKQLRAILFKYKNLHENKVFKVVDKRKQEGVLPDEKHKEDWKEKVEYESELQKKLRDIFGIDLVFHHKDDKQPFGYTLIDHKTGAVYKGSEIMKMNELFEFTKETIDKKLFERLKDYTIQSPSVKSVLIQNLKNQNLENVPKDFMLFENKKRKSKEDFQMVKKQVKEFIAKPRDPDIKILKDKNEKFYVIHERLHYVGELESLLGKEEYQKFLEPSLEGKEENLAKELNQKIDAFMFELRKSSGGNSESLEEENKKRRKRKKK